jgi:hypothetical protein
LRDAVEVKEQLIRRIAMAKKSGPLHRIASKTLAAGRDHVSKVFTGEETLPEAAGAVVEDLLSSAKAKSAAHKAEDVLSKSKASTKRKPTVKSSSARKKSKKA